MLERPGVDMRRIIFMYEKQWDCETLHDGGEIERMDRVVEVLKLRLKRAWRLLRGGRRKLWRIS